MITRVKYILRTIPGIYLYLGTIEYSNKLSLATNPFRLSIIGLASTILQTLKGT